MKDNYGDEIKDRGGLLILNPGAGPLPRTHAERGRLAYDSGASRMIEMPRPVPAEPTDFLETELVCSVHNLTYHAHLVRCPECADEARPEPELP